MISKSFSQSLEQFFLTVGQNNFGNKIPFIKTNVTPVLDPDQTLYIRVYLDEFLRKLGGVNSRSDQ